jgi:hypothetical protein
MALVFSAKAAAIVTSAVVVGMVSSGCLVWQASQAAFSDTTENPANTWDAGTVIIGDDDSGTAMFTATGLKPGSTGTKCLAVTYTGTLTANVKLYATAATGTLMPYLDLTVAEGTAGTFAGCGAFAVAATPFTGTLTDFKDDHADFGTGVGNFNGATNPTTKVYRFTWTLNAATPDSVQGGTAAATFVWEAQNV